MNKRRLLLFSVFALLHITTSERNFIDGRCCNHSSRSLFSDTGFSTYETHRVQRFLPELQQLNNPEKYPNPNKRDTEITRLSRRRQIGYIKQHARNNEIRETLERHRKRKLSSPTEEIQGRQNFRERIRERSNALRNDFRLGRFATIREAHQRNIRMPSLSINDNRINDVTRNRYENIDVSRYNHNDRDEHKRDRKEIRRNLPELVERNIQRYTNRNNMRNDLERVVRLERNIRKIASERVNSNDRNSRVARIRNLDEELSQNELSRKINNVRTDDRMNFNDNGERSVSNNHINRRSVRDTGTQISRIESRVRSESAQTIAINELATGTRNYKLELRETLRVQRENGRRSQSDRRHSFHRFDLNRERENALSIGRRSSDEMSRDRSNDARVQFERRNENTNVIYNRDTNEKEISEEKRERTNTSPDRSREYMNSKQYMERNMLESRISNTDRRSEGSDNRDRNENRLSVRRSHIERALERDNNKRTTRRNLQTEEIPVRDDLRGLERIQRSINDASDRMIRRNNQVFRHSPENRENDNSRRNFRELRHIRSVENRAVVERGQRLQADNRREIINDRIRIINVDRRLENPFKLTVQQDQNRITSRNNRNVMTVRSDIQIAKTNIEDDFRQRSRSLNYDRRLTGSRQVIRKTADETRQPRNTDDERKQTRKTAETSINMRRIVTVVNERRDSMMHLSENRRSTITYKIQYENYVFEMKWQYLFYALQLIYLCSILMKIPNSNKENKQKKRFADWFTPTEYLKTD